MVKSLQIGVVVVSLIILGACGIKPPIDDNTPPEVSIIASDSTFNINNPYSYMRYDSATIANPFAGTIGPRSETGFVTKDGSANFRVMGVDMGGVKSVVVRAQNGTITAEPYIGSPPISVDVTTEGDTDVLVLANTSVYAVTPIDHTVVISPKTANPEVNVSVEVLDMGGISGRSNVTNAPNIKLVFSAQ